jgi:hypothetical protein
MLSVISQAQLTETTGSPSPEVLKALADLIKATASSAETRNPAIWLTPDGLKAVATFISVVFRPQLKDIVRRLTEFEIFGVKGKMQRELSQSAQAAEKSEGLSVAPTPGELERAIQVERLTSAADLSLVRQQVDELAADMNGSVDQWWPVTLERERWK